MASSRQDQRTIIHMEIKQVLIWREKLITQLLKTKLQPNSNRFIVGEVHGQIILQNRYIHGQQAHGRETHHPLRETSMKTTRGASLEVQRLPTGFQCRRFDPWSGN